MVLNIAKARSCFWRMVCADRILNLIPSEQNSVLVLCVTETAMGTPVHAQEDLESTYVSAVYE